MNTACLLALFTTQNYFPIAAIEGVIITTTSSTTNTTTSTTTTTTLLQI